LQSLDHEQWYDLHHFKCGFHNSSESRTTLLFYGRS
jgi:hypothetical protein